MHAGLGDIGETKELAIRLVGETQQLWGEILAIQDDIPKMGTRLQGVEREIERQNSEREEEKREIAEIKNGLLATIQRVEELTQALQPAFDHIVQIDNQVQQLGEQQHRAEQQQREETAQGLKNLRRDTLGKLRDLSDLCVREIRRAVPARAHDTPRMPQNTSPPISTSILHLPSQSTIQTPAAKRAKPFTPLSTFTTSIPQFPPRCSAPNLGKANLAVEGTPQSVVKPLAQKTWGHAQTLRSTTASG